MIYASHLNVIQYENRNSRRRKTLNPLGLYAKLHITFLRATCLWELGVSNQLGCPHGLHDYVLVEVVQLVGRIEYQ